MKAYSKQSYNCPSPGPEVYEKVTRPQHIKMTSHERRGVSNHRQMDQLFVQQLATKNTLLALLTRIHR